MTTRAEPTAFDQAPAVTPVLGHDAAASYLSHLASVFGVAPACFIDGRARLVDRCVRERTPGTSGVEVVVVLAAEGGNCAAIGLKHRTHAAARDAFTMAPVASGTGAMALHSLHAYSSFEARETVPFEVIVRDTEGCAVWVATERDGVQWLVIGTALADDVLRFRQGDPERAADRSGSAKWDFAFERPNYLFERQLEGLDSRARHADFWCEAWARALVSRLSEPRRPLLPDGACGALVITGDDDQAQLEKYADQQRALHGLPITYLMHPLTRHDRRSAQRMFGRRRVELGLHPDALDQPTDYPARVAEQARWFESHFGRRALTVRNHGFLNDGYWGHLPAWEQAGLRMSSNIPGLDGSVLNGSLLPARMMFDGRLSSHWSILTTFGDGMVFALGLSDEAAAQKVAACASDIVGSRLPGIIVVNLHPQNIAETRRIHGVLRDIVATGFVPWTLSDCWRWFEDCTRQAAPSAWRHRMKSCFRAWAGSRA